MPTKKKTVRNRKEVVGKENSFIYPEKEATDKCARFAYRFPIEVVRAYEEIESLDRDGKHDAPTCLEIMRNALKHQDTSRMKDLIRIVETTPTPDKLTDSIITAIRDFAPRDSSGAPAPTMDHVIQFIEQGVPLHRMPPFNRSQDPEGLLKARIRRIAGKLKIKVSSQTRGQNRMSKKDSEARVIRCALYYWWLDNLPAPIKKEWIDEHGNPASSSEPGSPVAKLTRDGLMHYLREAGMRSVVRDREFWKRVANQIEKYNSLGLFKIKTMNL